MATQTESKQSIEKTVISFLASFECAFFSLDYEGKIDSFNQAALDLFNVPYEDLLGKPFAGLLSSGQDHIEFARKESVSGNKVTEMDRFFPETGKWLQIKIYPLENSSNLLINDITPARQAMLCEELEREVYAMNASGHGMQAVLNHLLTGINSIFPESTPSVLELDKSGTKLYNLCSPFFPDYYIEKLNGIETGFNKASCGTAAFLKHPVFVDDITTSELWKGCYESAASMGYISCWSFPAFDSSGNVLGSLGIYSKSKRMPDSFHQLHLNKFCRAIGILLEHKRLAAQLKLNNELFGYVTKATNDVIWNYDVATNTVFWGASFSNLVGIKPESHLAELGEWKHHVHEEDRDRVVASFWNVIHSDNQHKWEAEYRFMRKDGAYAYIFDRGHVIRDEYGKAIRMIGAMQDISERKQTEIELRKLNEKLEKRAMELQQSNAELEKFAYIASHDLKEPLRMISGFLHLLDKKYSASLDEKAMEYIGFAKDGAERMKELINDLLEYSRLTTAAPEFEFFNACQEIENVLFIFRNEIPDPAACFLCSSKLNVFAGKNRFHQLMLNLISNAVKYRSTPLPEIKIACSENENEWVFEISDNGIGIDPAYHDKIFEMFTRLHHRSEFTGTGIGLAICKKIIEQHNGTISVHSVPGSGSTFSFTIPKPASIRINSN
ncbi:MAG: PAS domain-containing protein [Bacteroidetes bacterium]|nr:PAS domain-containing protein [Bacteroidota bacterium]